MSLSLSSVPASSSDLPLSASVSPLVSGSMSRSYASASAPESVSGSPSAPASSSLPVSPSASASASLSASASTASRSAPESSSSSQRLFSRSSKPPGSSPSSSLPITSLTPLFFSFTSLLSISLSASSSVPSSTPSSTPFSSASSPFTSSYGQHHLATGSFTSFGPSSTISQSGAIGRIGFVSDAFAYNVGGIVGVAIGGVIALILGVIIAFFVARRKRARRRRQNGSWRSLLEPDDESVAGASGGYSSTSEHGMSTKGKWEGISEAHACMGFVRELEPRAQMSLLAGAPSSSSQGPTSLPSHSGRLSSLSQSHPHSPSAAYASPSPSPAVPRTSANPARRAPGPQLNPPTAWGWLLTAAEPLPSPALTLYDHLDYSRPIMFETHANVSI
ncbi:hypothetical protein B0H13DRAFT_1877203 [Mycena leptocephala]|nr:hypothetical protein B0H13DRAFT_1877203 [Mycena leptocephala]